MMKNNIKERITIINSVDLTQRISFYDELVGIVDMYVNSTKINKDLSSEIYNCIQGMRICRLIENDLDLILLDKALLIARLNLSNKEIISVLKDILYYSKYNPENYNTNKLEQEIKELESKMKSK